ncbi:M15 family metallopeptidase [Helicobacter typhlonius]|uniref:M15 family metallopeptidase n=1 Tax=Helicobacter typhlonius TaxID=76936 RepID=UPI002FE315C4
MKLALLLIIIICSFAQGKDSLIEDKMRNIGLFALEEIDKDTFITRLVYDSKENFMKTNIYTPFSLHKCYLHKDMKEHMQKLAKILRAKNLKLIVYDCFRPQAAQELAWSIVPDTRYVAHPKKGSNHSRGIAIDVGLAQGNGEALSMPSAFDEFSPKAWRDYMCPQSQTQNCTHRNKLQEIMSQAGLKSIKTEWWHFELPISNKHDYPILSLP